jgi:hypothetical protein
METNSNGLRPVLLTRGEACKLLRLGLSKYKALVQGGALHEIPIGPRGRRLPLSEAERFVDERLAKAERTQ